MKRLGFLLFIFVIHIYSVKSYAQQGSSDEFVQIYLQEFSIYFQPNGCVDSAALSLDKGKILINLFECRGRMKFRRINADGKLILEGEYLNSIDTLKKYLIAKSAITGDKVIRVFSYFQPIPNGVWKYYENGRLYKSRKYIQGIISTKK